MRFIKRQYYIDILILSRLYIKIERRKEVCIRVHMVYRLILAKILYIPNYFKSFNKLVQHFYINYA